LQTYNKKKWKNEIFDERTKIGDERIRLKFEEMPVVSGKAGAKV